MILPLFAARFRARLVLPWAVTALVTGIAAVLAYLPAALEPLRFLRGEMPELFTALGFVGDSSLPFFLLGSLYGFLMPLFASLMAWSLARRLVVRPLQDGRMALLLAAPWRRASILLTLFLVMVAALVPVMAASFLGQALAALVFFPGADLLALARLAAGFCLPAVVALSLAFFLAVTAPDERRFARRARLAMGLSLVLLLASRLPGWPGAARFLCFWRLYDGVRLVFSGLALLPALAAACLSLALLALSLAVFKNRAL